MECYKGFDRYDFAEAGQNIKHIFCPYCNSNNIKLDSIENDLQCDSTDARDENMIIHLHLLATKELSDAEEFINLADKNQELSKTLYASAIVILLSFLEKITKSFFVDAAHRTAKYEEVDYKSTIPFRQSEMTLRQRMQLLPEVASDNKYKLNGQSTLVTTLHEMISKRNELIHRDNLTLTVNLAEIMDGLHNGIEAKKVNNSNEIMLAFDLDNLSEFEACKEEAQACLRAVKKYHHEIFIALDENMELHDVDSELLCWQ